MLMRPTGAGAAASDVQISSGLCRDKGFTKAVFAAATAQTGLLVL